jgi:hypothetical protein
MSVPGKLEKIGKGEERNDFPLSLRRGENHFPFREGGGGGEGGARWAVCRSINENLKKKRNLLQMVINRALPGALNRDREAEHACQNQSNENEGVGKAQRTSEADEEPPHGGSLSARPGEVFKVLDPL